MYRVRRNNNGRTDQIGNSEFDGTAAAVCDTDAIQTLPAKEKSLSSAYIFWVLFGAHYFYLHKPFKNIFLWLLCCIYIGVIWWVFDLFRMKSLVADCNREIAKQVIHDAILLYPKPQKVHGETIDAEFEESKKEEKA